ncbi:MAG: Crp/Fnr family transcriptional regulator [Bacteroidia bacterium]|nr:Crp/Fnr family transcriptional regulator [Bacteroidia bacterium]NNJ56470.1 Crp/Fnr family transcriptional regulator [Bacteroidia bacterium]
MSTAPFDIVCYENLHAKFQNIFEEELINEICLNGQLRNFKPDELVVDIGDKIEYLPLIVSGSLKIMTEDDDGKELLLYYLEIGDTCAVTLNCGAKSSKSKIRAISESDAELLFIPISRVEHWMAKYKSWRDFILETYNYRMTEMLEAIDNLAFNNMEERIYKYLRDKAMVTGDKEIHSTHSQIANDLHSSRVVISRILSKLEKEGLITHGRNKIVLTHL